MKTDKELVLDFKNGNAVAFDDLVDRYRQPLFSYLGADSQTQDIIQETFQKVHEKIGQFNDTSPFKAWIYRIARNCQIDASRKERRRLDKLNDYISTFQEKADTAPSEKIVAGEIRLFVRQAINSLSEMQREVLIMNYFHGLSYPEIAGVLCCSVSSVKTHMSRAIMNLARTLPDVEQGELS
ncbi:MAG: RNA polymerase sigma factor [Lentisphaerales bacterium]|nr:RNA polymerase sigma factor [Lentisphaerales bacterium]